jgi:Flp pilus assembly protein TadD
MIPDDRRARSRSDLVVAAVVSAVFGVVLLGVPSLPLRPAQPAPRTRNLQRLIAAGDFGAARELAVEARRLHPDDDGAARSLARIDGGLGRPADEAAAWEDYLRLAPATPDVCLRLSSVYRSLGQPLNVAATVERCLALEARQPELLGDLAAARLALGDRTAAVAAMERAVAMQPSNPAFRVRLASLLLDDGRLSEARIHAAAALESEPGSLAALRVLKATE